MAEIQEPTGGGPFLEAFEKPVTDTVTAEEIPLSKMSKAELVAHAESIGVNTVPDSMTKKDIIELIEKQ